MSTTPSPDRKMVTGLFQDRASAERGYHSLMECGHDKADISLVMSDATRERSFAADSQPKTELSSKAGEAGQLGGPVGATIGTMIPALVAVGTFLALPGLGLIVAGPVAAAIAGAGAAGLAAGVIGALADWGIPKDRIQQYDSGIQDGGILMAVKTRSDQDARHIEQQWNASGAKFVHC